MNESGKLLPLTTQHLNYFISWKFSCYFTLYSEQDPYCTTTTYSSGSKKGYQRGLGHVGERLEQESWNESILEVTEKWKLNMIDCQKSWASFYMYRCTIVLIVDITTLDNSMFEKSYFRQFPLFLYTQEPPMLKSKLSKKMGFFVRSDEFPLSNTLSYLQISIPKSNTSKRKQNVYLTTAT